MLMRYDIWQLLVYCRYYPSSFTIVSFRLEFFTNSLTLQEPNPSEAEIGNQMDANDVAGVNTEQRSSGDIIEPSSSLTIEDNNVLSSDKVPHLTEEGICKDASEVSYFAPT